MNEFWEMIYRNIRTIGLIGFSLLMLIVILVSTIFLDVPVVAVCFLIVIESLLAVTLHKAELWIHGVLVIAQLIVGIVTKHWMLAALCILIYVASTCMLQFLKASESGRLE